MNDVKLIGNLGQQPEIAYHESGTVKTTFSIAVTEMWNDNKRTDWINILCWGKLAETIAEDATVGDTVLVVGKIRNESYEKEGKKKYRSYVLANKIKVFKRKAKKVEEGKTEYVSIETAEAMMNG